jgi:hypothetical protein
MPYKVIFPKEKGQRTRAVSAKEEGIPDLSQAVSTSIDTLRKDKEEKDD